jgi:ribosomal protein L29
MKAREVNAKSMEELTNLLASNRAQLQELLIKLRTEEVKNVRELRAVKKTIARAETKLSEQRVEAEAKNG